MIEVSVEKGKVAVHGHSGYASAGSDIVCAGVSALFQTMIKAIQDLTDDEITYNIASGSSDVTYDSLSEKSQILLDSFLTGISMMAQTYPDHVRLLCRHT